MTYTVLEARFVLSAPNLATCQSAPSDLPEVAFLGRSNVGKSSLIGELVGRKKLVKTSRTPGATRAVSFFHVEVRDDESGEVRPFCLADLPGYGWARVSREEKLRMTALLSGYLGQRAPLRCTCQLLDLRHAPTAEDRSVSLQLDAIDRPHLLVATKADKLPAAKRKPTRKALAEELGKRGEDVTLFSASEHVGRDELWARIWPALTRTPAPGAPPPESASQGAPEPA